MAFQKGHPGYRKGTKNKSTLLKEERRALFDEEVTEMFIETIKKARPEYLLDQYLGKAPDKLELGGELKTNTTFTPELIEIAKEELRKRLKDGT